MNEENNFNMGNETPNVETPVFEETPVVNPAPAVEPAPVAEPTGTQKPKGKKGSIAAIIIFLILVIALGVGYFLYSEGYIFNKKSDSDTKETDKKSDTKKDSNVTDDTDKIEVPATEENVNNTVPTTTTGSGQYVKVTYTDAEKISGRKVFGPFTINGIEYKVTADRYDCYTSSAISSHLDECAQTHGDITGYHTNVYISRVSDNKGLYYYQTSRLINEVAVLGDRYLYINAGEYGDTQPSFEEDVIEAHLLFDSKNSFKPVDNDFDNYDTYYDNNLKGTTREIGYVDSNTFKYGSCKKSNTQSYVEYEVKIVDGKVTTKEVYRVDNTSCSAERP